MDDVPILEVYSSEGAARLSAKLNGVDRRELAEKAQARIKLAYQRLAHYHLRKWSRAGGAGSIAFTIRISQPSKADGCDCCPQYNPQSGWQPSVSPLALLSGCAPIRSFVHAATLSDPLKPLPVSLRPVGLKIMRSDFFGEEFGLFPRQSPVRHETNEVMSGWFWPRLSARGSSAHSRNGRDPAVDQEVCPDDVRRIVRREVNRQLRDFQRIGDPFAWIIGSEDVLNRLALLFAWKATEHCRVRRPWA